MDDKSLNIAKDKIEQLKQILPEAFTEGKVDWEKLRLALGEDINIQDERYVLNWAGKSDAFRALQTPTTATLAPVRDESVNFDTTENIFIEGENLEVLKILQKSYYGKIKMIYIDPPYNTGNDSFVYPDKFSESREAYLKRIQAKDEDGLLIKEGMFRINSKDSGHYHSNWLSMMYPRLFLARNLLGDDGVIFVSIGSDEVQNLRLLMDEIFGEENCIVLFSRMMKSGGAKGKFFTPNLDYILVYAKDITSTQFFRAKLTEDQIGNFYNKTEKTGPRKGEIYGEERIYKASLDSRPNQRYWVECPDGTFVIPPGENFPESVKHGEKILPASTDGVWKWIFKRYQEEYDKGNIIFKQTTTSALVDADGKQAKWNLYNKLWLKDQQEKGMVPSDFIAKYENRQSSAELKELNIPFDFAKPSQLLKYLVEIAKISNDDIILDFFSGSSSTAHAVLEVNKGDMGRRKFVLVQLPEPTDSKSEAHKAGFQNIAEIGKERIRRVIQKIKEENPMFAEQKVDLGFKVFKLKNSNFKLWRGDGIENAEELVEQLDFLNDPVREDAIEENMLTELLLKSGYPLTAQVIKQKVGESHYYLVNGELAVALGALDENLIRDAIQQKVQQFICLDRSFADNDQLKTNTQLQLKDAGIAFHSI